MVKSRNFKAVFKFQLELNKKVAFTFESLLNIQAASAEVAATEFEIDSLIKPAPKI